MAAYRSQPESELLLVIGGMTWIDPTLLILLPLRHAPCESRNHSRRAALSRVIIAAQIRNFESSLSTRTVRIRFLRESPSPSAVWPRKGPSARAPCSKST